MPNEKAETLFEDEHNAAHAYNKMAVKNHGEFALLNVNLKPEYEESVIFRNNTSGYIGVRKRKGYNRFEVSITHNKKRIHLGSFGNPIDAAKAYNEAAIKFHGEKAKLNKI